MRISVKCPHCGRDVQTQVPNESIARDDGTRDLTVSVDCKACQRTFTIPLNLPAGRPDAASRPAGPPSAPPEQRPDAAGPAGRQPETGEPQFSRLARSAPEGPAEPSGGVSFAPVSAREAAGNKAPEFTPAGAPKGSAKKGPAPATTSTGAAREGWFKRLPEWAQWLVVLLLIVVVGVVIFALPFGNPPAATTAATTPEPQAPAESPDAPKNPEE